MRDEKGLGGTCTSVKHVYPSELFEVAVRYRVRLACCRIAIATTDERHPASINSKLKALPLHIDGSVDVSGQTTG